nr:hypothetical protein Iba_chr09cCG10940 [Ipomoea batatas]
MTTQARNSRAKAMHSWSIEAAKAFTLPFPTATSLLLYLPTTMLSLGEFFLVTHCVHGRKLFVGDDGPRANLVSELRLLFWQTFSTMAAFRREQRWRRVVI